MRSIHHRCKYAARDGNGTGLMLAALPVLKPREPTSRVSTLREPVAPTDAIMIVDDLKMSRKCRRQRLPTLVALSLRQSVWILSNSASTHGPEKPRFGYGRVFTV